MNSTENSMDSFLDMDVDFDLDDDKIKQYLKSKLEEIKSSNLLLQKTLERHRDEFRLRANKWNTSSTGEIIMKKLWIHLFNNKYGICFSVENNTLSPLENVKLLLRWDSELPLLYEFLVLESEADENDLFEGDVEWNFGNLIKKKANIIIVINCPQFLDKLSYELEGILIHGNDKVIIPQFHIASEDVINSSITVPVYKLIEGNFTQFLTCIACSKRTNFIAKFVKLQRRSILAVLEVDCQLFILNMNGRIQGNFFVAHKLSPIFDGTIVGIFDQSSSKDVFKMVIYSRNGDSTSAVLHHLLSNIEQAILLPSEYEDILKVEQHQDSLQTFKKCVNDEIKFASLFLKQHKGDLISFKLALCDLQKKTDSAFIHASNN